MNRLIDLQMIHMYIQTQYGDEHELDVTGCDPADSTLCGHLNEPVTLWPNDWIRVTFDDYLIGCLRDMYEITADALKKGPEDAGLSEGEYAKSVLNLNRLRAFLDMVENTDPDF